MKAEDISGKIYNELTAIEHVGRSYWKCLCSCGKETVVRKSHLLSGRIKSCGHIRKEQINLINKRFGLLFVVEKLGPIRKGSRQIYWRCICDCGRSISISSSRLLFHNQKTCNRNRIEHNRINDISDQKFGRLIPLKIAKSTSTGTWWLCLCDCGNLTEVTTSSLHSGDIKSCGCLLKESLLNRPSGPEHHNWNLTITDQERSTRRKYIEICQWAKDIKARDNYTCQICRTSKTYLHSHHLDSYRAHPERRTDPSNGVTLCKDCHKKFHSTYGRKVTYEWQFVEYYFKNQNQKFLKLDIAA